MNQNHPSSASPSPASPSPVTGQAITAQQRVAALLPSTAAPARSPLGTPVPFRHDQPSHGLSEPLLNGLLWAATIVGLGSCLL